LLLHCFRSIDAYERTEQRTAQHSTGVDAIVAAAATAVAAVATAHLAQSTIALSVDVLHELWVVHASSLEGSAILNKMPEEPVIRESNVNHVHSMWTA
jgi:hypothetical protein